MLYFSTVRVIKEMWLIVDYFAFCHFCFADYIVLTAMIFYWFGEPLNIWEERKDNSESKLFLEKYRHGLQFTLSLFDVDAIDTGISEGKGANASS